MNDQQQLDEIMDRPDVKDYVPGKSLDFVSAGVKLDGFRMTLWKDSAGTPHAIGRKRELDMIEQLEKVDAVIEAFDHMPSSTAVDGELHLEVGAPATDVRRAMFSEDENVFQRLRFTAFSLPLLERRPHRTATLDWVENTLAQMGFTLPSWPSVLRPGTTRLDEEWVSIVKDWCRAQRLEGIVLKREHRMHWWKVKPVRTLDAVVMATLPGVGKHYGKVGALMITLREPDGRQRYVGKVGSGLTDEERALPASSWVGRVVEVEYDSVAAAGRLRMPVFLRARDDKPAEECTVEQLQP